MSLKDRDYMQRPDQDAEERPTKPKIWVLIVSLLIVLLFLLSLWPRH